MADPSFFDRMITHFRATCKYEHHQFVNDFLFYFILLYELIRIAEVK